MTDARRVELRAAIDRASQMPDTLAKLDALELLARQTDELKDPPLGFLVRHYLFHCASHTSQYRHGLAAYGWLRATFDRDPDGPVPLDYMLRIGSYVVDTLDPFIEIPTAKIESLYAEQEALYRKYRRPLAALHWARISTEISLGRPVQAREAYEAWNDEATGHCRGCEQARHAQFRVFIEDDAGALERAEPFTSGRLKCDNQPIGLLHDLLLPLARLGEWETARGYHERTHRYSMSHPDSIRNAADVITFSAIDDHLVKARNLYERALPYALTQADSLSRVIFYTAALVYLAAAKRAGPTLTVTLPHDFPVPTTGKKVEVAALEAWTRKQATDLATAFDARNGTDYYTQKLQRIPSLLALRPT